MLRINFVTYKFCNYKLTLLLSLPSSSFCLTFAYFAFILPFYFPFSHFLSPFFLFLSSFFLFLLHFPLFPLRLFIFFPPIDIGRYFPPPRVGGYFPKYRPLFLHAAALHHRSSTHGCTHLGRNFVNIAHDNSFLVKSLFNFIRLFNSYD